MNGPLHGVRIIELAGLGALPYGSLRLADMGADIVRVERLADVPDEPVARPRSTWDRGRRSIAVDLKHPDGVATVLRLAEQADVFLESFRPGVVERLGLGPDVLHARNPRLVYGRLTGWGQTGPLAAAAGHSLNYESITGVIRAIGPAGGPPVPLLQIIGDFAGGGLSLAYGVVCALLHAQRTGEGQVVDAAMVDGTTALLAPFFGMAQSGMHTEEMGSNLFDGGAPFYAVYETADGRYLSVAPIEPHFYALLLDTIGLDPATLPAQYDRTRWPELKAILADVFRTRTRDEWCALLEGTDACVAPVLTFAEARAHPHNVARDVFVDDTPEIAIAPRLSHTPGDPRRASPAHPGADTDAVLAEYGVDATSIAALRERRRPVKGTPDATVGGTMLRRRAVSIPGVFALLAASVLLAPLLFAVAAVVDVVTGRRGWPHVRLAALAVAVLAIEAVGIVACGALWLAFGAGRGLHTRPAQRAHFALQHWWFGALLGAAQHTVNLRIQVDDPTPAARGNAIVIGRHTSIGDAVIPGMLLGNLLDLRPRYVLKRSLMWSPCIDLVGHRLPHHFVERNAEDNTGEVAALRAIATGLDDRTSVVIFPEGTFFTPARRLRSLERIRNGSRPELAERAARLHHVLPPRPAGTLALLDGAPGADVVVLGHLGFEQFTSIKAIRRAVPFRTPVRVWLWRVPRAEVPTGRDARVDWLYDQWHALDASIAARASGAARPEL